MAEASDNPDTTAVAMTPLERAAQAIMAKTNDGVNYRFDFGEVTEIARAVLTAIRDPSYGMRVASPIAETDRSAAIWQAMIDAALAECE